jgi:hypothetical protein
MHVTFGQSPDEMREIPSLQNVLATDESTVLSTRTMRHVRPSETASILSSQRDEIAKQGRAHTRHE